MTQREKEPVVVLRDDGTKLELSWAEAHRAHDAFRHAVLEKDLERLGWSKREVPATV